MNKLSKEELDFVFGLLYDAMNRADDPEWVESVMAKLDQILWKAAS